MLISMVMLIMLIVTKITMIMSITNVDEKSDFLLRTYLSLIQLKGINDDLFC